MEKTAERRICSSLCFFKPSLLFVAVFVSSLAFTCFLNFGFSPYLVTIPILFLSTLFIVTFSKKKVIVAENPAQDGSPIYCPKSLLEEEVGEKLNPELETVAQGNAAEQSEVCCIHDEYQVETTDCPSDSESSDDFSASENFELSWICSDNAGQNAAISESSISDDEEEEEDGDDLIEINLPKNSSIDMNAEESKQKLESNLPDYLPESIFSQEGLMELLADINEVTEEENLIEIDLSMGSIKCSTFEIEA